MSNNDIYLNKKTVNIGRSIKVINYYANDTVIGKSISDGFYHDASKFKIINENRIKNRNLLDIGAFIGTTSLLMAELVLDEDSVVYAFEPVYFECLEKNIKDNGLDNKILAYQCGLSSVNGFVQNPRTEFTSKTNYGGQSLLLLHEKNINHYIIQEPIDNTIEIKRLDDFKLKNLGLIKIDVEGMELEVLKGGVDTIRNSNYPPIIIEIWDVVDWRKKFHEYYQKNILEITSFLQQLGYKVPDYQGEGDYLCLHS